MPRPLFRRVFDLPLKYVSNARNAHTHTQQQHLGVINAIALRLKVCTAKSADRMRCPPFTPHPLYSSSDNKLRARKPTEGNFYSFRPLLPPTSGQVVDCLFAHNRQRAGNPGKSQAKHNQTVYNSNPTLSDCIRLFIWRIGFRNPKVQIPNISLSESTGPEPGPCV